MKMLGKIEEGGEKIHFDFLATDNPEGELEEARRHLGADSHSVSWEAGKPWSADPSKGPTMFDGSVYGEKRQQLTQFQDFLATSRGWEYDEP
jgi:hypothetical protein